MNYHITCVCGANVPVEAANYNEGVGEMVKAMDEHIQSKPHPEVPSDLTEEQKLGMVQAQMKEDTE
jgi:hypothetical protein